MDKPASSADKRKLLARLLQNKSQPPARPSSEISPRSGTARLPLSYAQLRLWLLDQMEPASPIYTISTTCQLTGSLRVDILEASINEIVRRHEALRTVFLHDHGQPYQLVQPFQPIRLPVIELGTSDDDAALAAHLARAGAQPFDLRRGPLFRVGLLRRTEHDHLLSLEIHHIISDAWSFKLFTQELAALYTALARGEQPRLPALSVQYADYCVWEQQWLRGDVLEAPLAYWKQQLAGTLPVIQLPADRVRQAKQTYRGALHRFYLPRPLVDGLKAFSLQAGVTPFMTLLAVFQTLIYRYTGQDDVLVGSAFAGRNQREVHDLIGFFVNTLPLRVSLAGQPSFTELLRRVREVALGAYAHQDLPFIKLVEHVQPDRDTSYSPVVQIMFVLRQKAPAPTYRLPDLTLGRPREVDGGVAKFELSWSMEEEEADFLSQIEYNADLFDAARIERLGGHFQTLLEAALRDPQRSITTLPLLPEDEHRRIVRDWNPASGAPPRTCFHRLFEAQVASDPERVAVVSDDERLSYAALDAAASRLARHLRELHVGPDVLVGICLERSAALVVAILGVFKAGGAYVPIDPTLPPERIGFLLEDARLSLVVAHHPTSELLRAQPAAISIVDLDALPVTEVARALDHAESTSRLAYVIYTSGSTGRPKGVQVEHSGLHNLLEAQIATFGVTRHSRVLQFASMSFDASIFEIVMALGTGATLVLGSHLAVGTRLVELLERHAVTHATLPPSVLANLPDAELPALQTIITAGEACSPLIAERWAGAHALFNAYGPTEATVWSTVARCEAGSRVTIGTPITRTQIYLLDQHLEVVPVGVPGQIHIGGAGLARGYLHRAQLTAQSFIPNPFGPPGSRLYRTGDIARYLEDGSIDFLGRSDEQVKLRGFRIELEEIELALLQHPAVREAVVIVKGDGPDKQLVAFHVASLVPGQPAPTAGALRAFIKQKLPSYMVPSAFVAMTAFPLTSSNKIDRQALASFEVEARDPTGYRAPTTAVEEIIADVWAAVLNVERVGIDDNFFELGGHSLQATQVVSRVADALSRSLPLSVLFERPTVAELASFLEDERREARQLRTAAIEPAAAADRYRLSFAQQRMWFLDSMAPGQAEYNIPTVIDLRGALDTAALRGCLAGMVARHESLRTQVIAVDGVPGQVITARPLDCPIIDLGHLPPDQQEHEAQRLTLAEARRAFDLAADLPIRATLLCRHAEHHALLLTIHHIAADDRSMTIFLQDLNLLYAAATRGALPDLPALAVQYRDFAEWQRRWLTGELLERQLAYWRQQLANLPPPSALPADRARPAIRSNEGDSAAHLIPAPLVEALKQVSRQESCTLFMTVLAAFKTLVVRYTGEDDVVIGTAVANRSRRETENVIGFFGNTLVLRTDLSGNPTLRTVLARVRKMALDAYDHADLPFEVVVDKLGLARDLGNAPVLRIVVALQEPSPLPERIGNVAVSVCETDNKTAKFDLVVLLRLTDDGLVIRAQYSTAVFHPTTIDRMLGHLHRLLAGIAANPDQRLDAVSLVTEDEHDQQRSWNATGRDYPQHCVHELFEAQAQRTPEAIAVVWQASQLTYRQLNQRANQLAHHLRRLGVGPETPVGVYMHRSPDMVVSFLGILKAGGAYVPLDPAYPRDRIAFMVSDARIPVVLTHRRLTLELAPHTATVVDLAADGAALSRERPDNPLHRGHVDHLAYVIYTSGSTGQPKGVAVSHRAINRLVFNTNYVQFGAADRVAQASSASFDAATFEIWGALLHGARLIGIEKEVALSAGDFTAHLQDQGITVLFLTTALFNLIASTVPSGLRSVRNLLFGGEAVDRTCVRQVLEHGPPERLLHVYGPTENTTFSSWQLVQHVPDDAITVPIGRPISNTQIYLLDARLQPVPVGIPGELHIGGAGLARCYLNRPALTAERFIPDPWSGEPGARLYKTGDLARYLADGSIEFLRRLDFQVKLRGYRIELGEIEATLRSHPAVADAVVLVREEVPGHHQLAAYVVYANPQDASPGELRLHVSRLLPSFMVPSAFIALDGLPLSPSGKLDRRRLAQVQGLAAAREVEYVAPRSELERTISAVWQDVLKLAQVGIHDNFFDLGGSSLLAPQVVAKLNERLQRKLALLTVFQYPSVSALAKFLSQDAAPEPGFTRTAETIGTMRASRSRQAERRRKLGH